MNFRLRNVFYGWWIVGASFVVNSMANGFYWLGFSVFFLPLSRELEISRAAASLPFTLRGIVAIFLSPLIGLLVDRFGPAKVLFVAAILGGLGYLLLSQVNSYLLYVAVFLGVVSLGMLPFDSPTTTVTGRWFVKKRAWAMALASMGFAFGGAVITPLVALGIDRIGWQQTALIIAIVIWAVAVPLATRLYRSPESRGLRADGAPPTMDADATERATATGPATVDFTPRETLRTPAYWMLCVSCGLRGMVFMATGLHLVAIIAWKGIDETTAGFLIGGFAFVWMVVTPFMGWAGDRWSKARIAALPAFLGTLAIALILVQDEVTVWQMALLLVLWGTNEGSWTLNFTILADLFGNRHYGTIRGGTLTVVNFMSFGAPFYSGWVFDHTESYQLVLLPGAILLGVAGLLNWFLPKSIKPRAQPEIPFRQSIRQPLRRRAR